jgi:hypothetical protein
MEELLMTVELKNRINLGVALTGWLAHDNKLFDRSCTACGGMYSSFVNATCPKCGQVLTYLRIPGNQKALCISEGTMYPALSKNQLEKDAQAITARKRAVPITYRFKVFGFADEQGVLVPPAIHKRLRKGALVEVRMYNHQPVITPFQSEKGPKVEMMLMVFEAYGDKVTVLTDAKAADATTPVRTNPDGTAAPVQMPDPNAALVKQVADMQAQVATLTTLMAAKMGVAVPTQEPAKSVPAPVQTASAGASIEDALTDEDCPFDPSELEDDGTFDDGASIDPFKIG